MAKTIFDMPMPRPSRSGISFIGGDPAPEKPIPSQEEEGEPEVVCDPPLGRNVFGYLEPRKGIDAPGDFRSCMSCASFIPERAFHAATFGNRCQLLGSFPIEPMANCYRWRPWPMGKPVEAVVEAHALGALNGARSSLSPFDVGYSADTDDIHQCRGCRNFDPQSDDVADGAQGPHCEAMEQLNRALPKMFQVNESVDPNGGCSAWTEPANDEPDEIS